MASLEEQFEESEKKRLEIEQIKERILAGLPLTEPEPEAEPKEPTDFERLNGLMEKIAEQTATLIQEQATQIGKQALDIEELQQMVIKLQQQFADLLSQLGGNLELERETLQNLNKYLKDWL